jgi:PAS domain S-box-containing protein
MREIPEANTKTPSLSFLSDGGEMGALIRTFDWQQNSLGPPARWPPSLCTAVGILLHSKFPMFLFWGGEAICFYNDAYRPSLGKEGEGKHPCLGKRGADVWPEIWHIIGSQIEQVMAGGEATWHEDQLVPIFRNGAIEDVYWTYSYSPVFSEEGGVAGVFVTCTETTEKVRQVAQLAESENRFRIIADVTPNMVWAIKPDGTTKYVNRYTLDYFGRRADDFPGDWSDMVHPGDIDRVRATMKEAFGRQKDYRLELRLKRHDGVFRYFVASGAPAFNADQTLYGYIGSTVDINDIVEAEEKVSESEERFRSTFENAAVGVAHVGLDGSFLFINNKLSEIIGYTKQELNTLTFQHITHPDDLEADLTHLHSLLAGRITTYSMDKRYICKNGSVVWINLTVSLARNDDGSPKHFISIVKDISERKKAEEALAKATAHQKETLALLESLLKNAPIGFAFFDKDYRYLHVNSTLAEINGIPAEDHIGKTMEEVLPENAKSVVPALKKVAQTREPILDLEVQGETPKEPGVTRYWLTGFYPVLNEKSGDVDFVGAVVTEITERKRAEEKIRKSEISFRTLVEEAPVATCLFVGREMKIEIANEKIIAIMGKGRSVIGKPLAEALPELEGQPFLQELDNVFVTGNTYENRNARAELMVDGVRKTSYFDYIFKPLRDANGDVYAVLDMTIDVTDHVLARRELQESENRFRSLANDTSAYMFMADAEANVTFVNRRWLEFVGMDLKEDIGQAWTTVTHPDDIQLSYDVYADAVRNLKPYQLVARQRRADGQWRWIRWDGIARKDASGSFAGVIGVGLDVTEQKQFAEELEALVAERTRELQRSNEDLQQFAHVASHDLKEPVRKVITFQSRLRDELGDAVSEKARLYLQKIEASSQRMYSMIDGVLAYSALAASAFTREAVDLNEVLRNIEADLEVLIAQKQATISHHYLPVVSGSPVLLYQLFYNLIANSLKFAKAGVNPVISVTAFTVPRPGEPGHGQPKHHRIVLADNGIGFRQSDAELIFQTFTRLNSKDKYEGTGLGLSLCKKIAERHGGSIFAEAEEGKGARFTVILPVDDK